MNFVSPWMLLGLIGAVIPVIVHLQGRRKAKVIHFAALDFLMGTDKRLAKKLVLRQIAALLARVAICLIVPLVLAQPYASCSRSGPLISSGPQAVVLIIDNSVASGYRVDSRSLLSRSIASAKDILSQLGPEAEVAVITTTRSSNTELSRDHLNLRTTLESLEVSFAAPDMRIALAKANQLLTNSSHKKNTTFIFALPTRATVPDTKLASPGITTRVISPVEEDTEMPNLAITDLQVVANGSIGSRGVSVIAQVKNAGKTPKTAYITLKIGKKTIAKGELSLAAHETKKKRFSANLVDEARAAQIQVQLQDDNLNADNARYVIADSRDEVSVLLINGDPRTIRHEDELFYVEAALRPGDRSDSGTKISMGTPDTLQEFNLDSFDVIVLANVSPLPSDQVTALSSWVAAGGGLFVSMGNNVAPNDYNKRMTPLLAQQLRVALDLQSGRKTKEGNAQRLSKIESEHPIFSVFQKDAPGLYNASFHQIMLLGPTTKVKHRHVLARFTNGAAALIETRRGKGKVLLFTSSLDRDWNNLPIFPGFLPFLQGSIRYLASKPFQDRKRQILIGESVQLLVAANDRRLEIEGPNALRFVLEGDKVANRKSARLEPLQVPGFYSVKSAGEDESLQARPESSFAVNIDSKSSDVHPISAEVLESLASEETSEERGAGASMRRVELWHGIAAGLLLFLLLESMIGLYTGRSKRPRAS